MTPAENTRTFKAYPHAAVLEVQEFAPGHTGWYGSIETPEVGRISVFAVGTSKSGPARTAYRFTRDGVEYATEEPRYRSSPRGAAIIARNWARGILDPATDNPGRPDNG